MTELKKKRNENELLLAVQLDLFKTKKINLSALYTSMPLETMPKDERIQRDSDGNVKPDTIEETFTINKQAATLRKIPAIYKSHATKKTVVQFPYMREARVEQAINSILAKKQIDYDTDINNNTIFFLQLSLYAIRKEIVEAINKYEGKNLKVQDCPYKANDIKDALECLSGAGYVLEHPDFEDNGFKFSRIKDVYQNGENYTIEIGSFVSRSIKTGDWNVLEPSSLLASREFYEYRLKLLLYMNFRNARKEASFVFEGHTYKKPYTATLDFLCQKMQYGGYKQPSRIIQHIKKMAKGISEIDEILVTPVKQGRTITMASKIHIVPSDSFVNSVIENNILSRRSKEQRYVIDGTQQEYYIEPLRSEFESESAYNAALLEYRRLK